MDRSPALRDSLRPLYCSWRQPWAFLRTPKFNILTSNDKWAGNKYIVRSIGIITILEGLLTFYFLFGIISAFVLKEYGLLPFHIMLFWGFTFVFINSLRKH